MCDRRTISFWLSGFFGYITLLNLVLFLSGWELRFGDMIPTKENYLVSFIVALILSFIFYRFGKMNAIRIRVPPRQIPVGGRAMKTVRTRKMPIKKISRKKPKKVKRKR